MKKSVLVLAGGLCIGALTFTGCGDDDDAATDGTTAGATDGSDTSAATTDTGPDRDWQTDETGSNGIRELPGDLQSNCTSFCSNVAGACTSLFDQSAVLVDCATNCRKTYEKIFYGRDDEQAKLALGESEDCIQETLRSDKGTCANLLFCMEWVFPATSPFNYAGFERGVCLERCEALNGCDDNATFQSCFDGCLGLGDALAGEAEKTRQACIIAGADCAARNRCL
jgi:hypothetical protein